MLDALRLRWGMTGVLILEVIGVGYCEAYLTQASESTVAELMRQQVSAREAQSAAIEHRVDLELTPLYFEANIQKDLQRFGLEHLKLETIKKPNSWTSWKRSRTLAPGSDFRVGPLQIKAVIDKVSYQRAGATLTARHSLLYVQNTGKQHVAYFLRARSASRGECQFRGTRRHNVLALAPQERAEISICAGSGAIRVHELQILEVSALGYNYISQLPPQALGHDPASSSSHTLPRGLESCSQVPAEKIGKEIEDGTLRWVDVTDFYSRHSCERVQFPGDYKRATSAILELPVFKSELLHSSTGEKPIAP